MSASGVREGSAPERGGGAKCAPADAGTRTPDATRAPLLEARSLSFRYGSGAPVFSDVSLALRPRDVVLLVGQNGAGKSSLLACLAGWAPPASGEVLVDGERLDGRTWRLRRRVAFVADVPAFYDDLTAREHLDFVLRANRLGSERRREADELLERFGIARAADAYPSTFSRGMRQKLALALAFAVHPSVLIMDEPTGPLDPASRALLGELVRRAADEGASVLASCHHPLPGAEPTAVWELADGALRKAGR